MADRTALLRCAVFERLTTAKSFRTISKEHNFSPTRIKMAFREYVLSQPAAQPTSPSDLDLVCRPNGRPRALLPEEEDLILSVAEYYISLNTPLSRTDVMNLVEDVVTILPMSRRESIPFKNGRPSSTWLTGFLNRHKEFVMCRPVETEDVRVVALTTEAVGKHIARVKAAMNRYGIRHARQIYNLDETGICFRATGRRVRRKALGHKGKK